MSTMQAVLERINDLEATISQIERSQTGKPSFATEVSLNSLMERRESLSLELAELTATNQVDICDYRLVANSSDGYALSGVTKALHDFQDLVAIVFDALVNKPKLRGNIPSEIAYKTQFDFGFSYSGSLGVVLTIQNDRLLAVETDLDKTLKEVFALLRIKDVSAIQEAVVKLGVPAVRKLHSMTKAHSQFGLSADIKWIRDTDVKDRVTTQVQEMESIRRLIESRGDEVAEQIRIQGRLVAWSVPQRTFTIEYGDAAPITGHWASDFDGSAERLVLATFSAELTKTTIVRYVDEDLVRWTLNRLDPD